jgi:tetratricopeptide (TPR) repeat protein
LGQIQDQPTRTDSKTQLIVRHIEQIKLYLRSGDYSRALDLLRAATAEFPNDRNDRNDNNAELAELEKLAQDGVQRSAEANRLITESQELFAHQNSAEAIKLLRKAYALDKNNALARTILANALVEHAHSVVETDWLEAETLTNQALNLNPAHPTAKTILSLIVAKKETSSVDDWVSKARQLQSSGDLFAALAWVAEGLAVHPHNPKLLQIQDEIQRDQDARRRQARRGDLEDLRRMQHEIDGATDVAAKQALAVRIQTLAAKHWTDGEILSIANALLLRLGLVAKESSTASLRGSGKGATVILHVPRPSAPKPSAGATSPAPPIALLPSQVRPSPVLPTKVSSSQVPPNQILPSQSPRNPSASGNVSTAIVPPSIVPPTTVPLSKEAPSIVAPTRVPTSIATPSKVAPSIVSPAKTNVSPPESQLAITPTSAFTAPAAEPAPAVKVTSSSSEPQQPTRSNSTTLILVSAAVIILVAATFFFTRKHYASPVPNTSSAASTGSTPTVSAPAVPTAAVSAPAQTTPESSQPDSRAFSDPATGKVALDDQPANDQRPRDQPPVQSTHNLGTLLIIAGQDDAKVFLNGKLQPQLTRAGQLRLPNLELKDYVVQVSKSGFQDPPQQKIRIRNTDPAKLVFNLQPQPSLASLTIQGAAPGTTVFVDQTQVGTIQPDGTLSISTVNPGDHTVELRREKFKPRQFKKHFVVGGTISLAAADTALEAAPESTLGELKITFAPADATVALVKGDLLKMVSSGVPLNLAAGTYTLTARTAERFTRSSTLEVVAGQSKTLDLSLAPSGMSKWDDPAAWKHEGDSFTRKGGDFVLYGASPASGTFVFSGMPAKGRILQWVLNYSDPRNYVLFQLDENNFYRTVIHNGEKSDQIIVPDKGDKKSFRNIQIRVSPTEIIHEIKHGDRWTVLDRWTRPGTNLSLGKFGFYIPGSDQTALSSFAHYADLNIR